MKIYNKLFELDKRTLLRLVLILSASISASVFILLFTAILLLVSLWIQLYCRIINKLPLSFLFMILESIASGLVGFLLNFYLRGKDITTILFTAAVITIIHIIYKYTLLSDTLGSGIYQLLGIFLNIIFLFGFAYLGAKLLAKKKTAESF